MTPNEALKDETSTRLVHIAAKNEAEGKKRTRKSGLYTGDSVRVLRRKEIFSKGYEIRYSIIIYKIEKVEGNYYTLNNGKKYREGELQKVNAAPTEDISSVAKDVQNIDKKNHKVDQILKHKEGISQMNKREGLRERKPSATMQYLEGIDKNWCNL